MTNYRIVLLSLAWVTCLSACAQFTGIYLTGGVRDYESGKKIKRYTIEALDTLTGKIITEIGAKGNGTYELTLPAGPVYKLRCRATGKPSKTFILDLSGIPAQAEADGLGVRFDWALFNSLPGIPDSVWDVPMALGYYDAVNVNIQWDTAFTGAVMREWHRIAPAERLLGTIQIK